MDKSEVFYLPIHIFQERAKQPGNPAEGFTGTTGAEFLDWGLKLAEERLAVMSKRRKIIPIVRDRQSVYQREEGSDWELSLLHLHRLEARGITPIGVYLSSSNEDLVQLKQLFPRLVHTSGNALPDRLGDLLRGLA